MVGNKIRALRSARGMTVAELARLAEVSTGMISLVERDRSDPSLATVRKIARALNVPLFSLFEEDESEDVAVVRRDARMQVSSPGGGVVYTRISAGRGKLEVLEGSLQPGGASSDEPWEHPSEECVLVIAGKLIVDIAGKEYSLDVGDSCYFDSRLPHRYLNPFRRKTDFIISVTPPSF